MGVFDVKSSIALAISVHLPQISLECHVNATYTSPAPHLNSTIVNNAPGLSSPQCQTHEHLVPPININSILKYGDRIYAVEVSSILKHLASMSRQSIPPYAMNVIARLLCMRHRIAHINIIYQCTILLQSHMRRLPNHTYIQYTIALSCPLLPQGSLLSSLPCSTKSLQLRPPLLPITLKT